MMAPTVMSTTVVMDSDSDDADDDDDDDESRHKETPAADSKQTHKICICGFKSGPQHINPKKARR